ncbi:MAG: HIT family protein [Candidatus Dormibacteria bacterium]
MKWPEAFYQMQSGVGCPLCGDGRPDATASGIGFHAGEVSDAYLRRAGIQRGLSVVVWRGRHVAEPTELTPEEAAQYWHELLTVGRAIEAVFRPVKLNYNLLGNSVPHLHTHIVPRYSDDPRPGWPFPFPDVDPDDQPDDTIRRDVDALREAIADEQQSRRM